MKLKINGKEYAIKFGIGFVKALDEKYNVAFVAGSRMGYGLETVIPKLLAGSAPALSEIIYEGTYAEESRPTEKEVDDFIDDMPDYDAFVEEVLAELKKHNATAKKVTLMIENVEAEEAQKKAREEAEKKRKVPVTK